MEPEIPELPERKWLRHQTPHWVDGNSVFFITVCAHRRGSDDLIQPDVPEAILNAAKFYHDQKKWWLPLILIMPDHLHMFVQFPFDGNLKSQMQAWKRYLAKTAKISWQAGFFDHRIRYDDGFWEKANYIRLNPVRAGLCGEPGDWEWQGGTLFGWREGGKIGG